MPNSLMEEFLSEEKEAGEEFQGTLMKEFMEEEESPPPKSPPSTTESLKAGIAGAGEALGGPQILAFSEALRQIPGTRAKRHQLTSQDFEDFQKNYLQNLEKIQRVDVGAKEKDPETAELSEELAEMLPAALGITASARAAAPYAKKAGEKALHLGKDFITRKIKEWKKDPTKFLKDAAEILISAKTGIPRSAPDLLRRVPGIKEVVKKIVKERRGKKADSPVRRYQK